MAGKPKLSPADEDRWVGFKASPKEAESVESLRLQLGVSISELLRRALKDFQKTLAGKAAPKKSKPQDRVLAELRKCGGIYLACERAGVDPKTVEEWSKETAFEERLVCVQRAWLEERQEELVQLGVGQRKGQVIALLGVLNSLHPDYGRAKAETINRSLKALMGDLATILQDELGGGNQAALNRALERFEQSKEIRLAHLT